MKRTGWKKLICLVLCLVMIMSLFGCTDSQDGTSSSAEHYFGDSAECTLCPDKERCCFCYQYGDCICVVVSKTVSGGDGSTSSTISQSGNRRPITAVSTPTASGSSSQSSGSSTFVSSNFSSSSVSSSSSNSSSEEDEEINITIESEEERQLYKPTSLSVTLYDAQKSIYGFTFNTTVKPLKPVIQIKKSGAANWSEYKLSSVKESSYAGDDTPITYYISKTEIQLEPNSTYVYRAYDKNAQIGTAEVTLKTKNPKAKAFTFVHVSDSQGSSAHFRRILSAVTDRADFLLHTGDVVETSKYEDEWTDMLDGNFDYLSRIPMMAISGNHETTYKNGYNETFKHFHNSMPAQSSTGLGYFYSFVYGDAKFLMLNTNDLTGNKLKDEQYNWLVNELKTNTCKWTVVALHNPLYSVGKYGSDSSRNYIALALQKQLRGIFAQYGVDLVLQGHDHTVSRTYPLDSSGAVKAETVQTVGGVEYSVNPNGVIYIMNGPAGNQTRTPVSGYDASLYKYAVGSQSASYAEIEVDEDTLTVTVKRHNGTKEVVLYKWGIKKS